MDFSFEVLVVIFSYLTPNDIMEVSAICKMFYYVSRKNKLFVKKLRDSRKLDNYDKHIYISYSDVSLSFSNQLFVYLKGLVIKTYIRQIML